MSKLDKLHVQRDRRTVWSVMQTLKVGSKKKNYVPISRTNNNKVNPLRVYAEGNGARAADSKRLRYYNSAHQ